MDVRSCVAAVAICLATVVPAEAAAEDEAEDGAVVWPARYPTFRAWEYAGTGVLLGGAVALRLGLDTGEEANVRGGFLLDEPVMSHGYISDPSLSGPLRKAGDAFYLGSLVFTAVEPLVVGIAHDWVLSGQLAAMGFEAYAVYSAMLFTSQAIVRSERPSTRLCDNPNVPEGLGISCSGNNPIRSFVGGHVGVVTTAATLTCVHHAHLPLYGGGVADAVPCAVWIGATAVTFASRTLSGKHWFSDNALGVAMGTVSGLVPYFLHYAYPLRAPSFDEGLIRPRGVAIAPSPDGSGGVLTLSGLFE